MFTPPLDPSHFFEELRIGRPTLCWWPANGARILRPWTGHAQLFTMSGYHTQFLGPTAKVQLTMGKGENMVWQDCQRSMHMAWKKSGPGSFAKFGLVTKSTSALSAASFFCCSVKVARISACNCEAMLGIPKLKLKTQRYLKTQLEAMINTLHTTTYVSMKPKKCRSPTPNIFLARLC